MCCCFQTFKDLQIISITCATSKNPINIVTNSIDHFFSRTLPDSSTPPSLSHNLLIFNRVAKVSEFQLAAKFYFKNLKTFFSTSPLFEELFHPTHSPCFRMECKSSSFLSNYQINFKFIFSLHPLNQYLKIYPPFFKSGAQR